MDKSEKVRPQKMSNEVRSAAALEEGADESEKVLVIDQAVPTNTPLYITLLRKLLCWKE